jgi:hypothetical protein
MFILVTYQRFYQEETDMPLTLCYRCESEDKAKNTEQQEALSYFLEVGPTEGWSSFGSCSVSNRPEWIR